MTGVRNQPRSPELPPPSTNRKDSFTLSISQLLVITLRKALGAKTNKGDVSSELSVCCEPFQEGFGARGRAERSQVAEASPFASELTSPSLDGTFPPSHMMGKTNSTLNRAPANVTWIGFKGQGIWSLRTCLRTDWKRFYSFFFFFNFPSHYEL